MREFFDSEMNSDAMHRARWRKGLSESEQEEIVEVYERDARPARGRGLPLRPGPAPLLRTHADRIRALSATPAPGADRPRILFTTSNGTGLGHLTRSMAIARRLGDEVEPLFLTLSAAAPVVEADGLRGRVRALVRDPGLRQRLPLVAPPARPPAGGDRRGRSGSGRLRRHPPLRGAARGAAGGRDRGLVPAAAVEARARAGCRSAAPAPSTRCSSRASWPSPRTPARPCRCAIAPTGSARSSSSTAPSGSIASGPPPSSGSIRRGRRSSSPSGRGRRCARRPAGRSPA